MTGFTADASSSSDAETATGDLEVRWDWEGDGVWDTPWTNQTGAHHAYSEPGVYPLSVGVMDMGGLTAMSSATIPILVDAVPPMTTASISGTQGGEGWYASSVTIQFNATDDSSGVVTTWARNNGGSWYRADYPYSIEIDGTWLVEYYSVDRAGNVGSIQSVDIGIDRIAPTVSVNVTGLLSGGWHRGSVTVVVSCFDATSGVSSVEYRLDGGAWMRLAGVLTVSAEGTHDVQVRAADHAGNEGSVSEVGFRVDAKPPRLTYRGPSGTVTSSLVVLAWDASDNVSGIGGYALSIDGAAFENRSDASVSVHLNDGEHTIVIRALDVAGNSAEVNATLRVDTNPFSPTGPYLGLPSYGVIAAAALAAFLYVLRRRRSPRV